MIGFGLVVIAVMGPVLASAQQTPTTPRVITQGQVPVNMAPPTIARPVQSLPSQQALLDRRLQRVERLLDSQGLMQMFNQMEHLRQDLQNLRGEFEELQHSIKGLNNRQRDQYIDLDQRINHLETKSGGSVKPVKSLQDSKTESKVITQTSVEELNDYNKAFMLLKLKKYPEAMQSFVNFLEQHPNSEYVENALYWLGEASYVTGDYKKALSRFQVIIDKYPDSNKYADALLKSGFVQYELKDYATATNTLNLLIKRFPDTSSAGLAKKRLQMIKRIGK